VHRLFSPDFKADDRSLSAGHRFLLSVKNILASREEKGVENMKND
jgi:hypothetical protein